MTFFDEITTIFDKYGYHLTEKQMQNFQKYYDKLIDTNAKFNLTSITEQREVIIKHFLDSIIGIKHIPDSANVIDIGCGAGFPSLPIKIMREDLNFLLIDSVNKKINFVNEVASDLNLKKILGLHARVEDLAQKAEFREKSQVVVSRAVAKLNTLCEYALPLLSIGGVFIAYKSGSVQEELNEAKNAIKILGGEIENVFDYSIEDNERCLVIIKKVNKTPEKYPRDKNKPRTNPL